MPNLCGHLVWVLAREVWNVRPILASSAQAQTSTILQGLVLALDRTLGLGMARGAAHMANARGLEVFGQFARDIAWAIVAQ